MATTQDARTPGFYAGLFLRTKNRTRFWGWGNPGWGEEKSANTPAAEMERPSPSLAEWLRMAHSLLDAKTVAPPSRSGAPGSSHKSDPANAASEPEDETRQAGFVCNKRVVGLVIR
jgi:hypothetical protein